MVLLSSHRTARARPGLVAYDAAKAALDAMAVGLRAEEPGLRVLLVMVGNTATGFADRWDPAAAHAAFVRWIDEGYLRHAVLEPAEVATACVWAAVGEGAPDDLWVVGAVVGPEVGPRRRRAGRPGADRPWAGRPWAGGPWWGRPWAGGPWAGGPSVAGAPAASR